MEQRYRTFPVGSEKAFYICDATIDEILFTDASIRFVFSKGFSVMENKQLKTCQSGYIEFHTCESEEFFCKVIKRKRSRRGALEFSRPVSLNMLSDILLRNHSIEIHLELYNFNYLYWRGTLHPNKKNALSDHVVIETSGCCQMSVCWE